MSDYIAVFGCGGPDITGYWIMLVSKTDSSLHLLGLDFRISRSRLKTHLRSLAWDRKHIRSFWSSLSPGCTSTYRVKTKQGRRR